MSAPNQPQKMIIALCSDCRLPWNDHIQSARARYDAGEDVGEPEFLDPSADPPIRLWTVTERDCMRLMRNELDRMRNALGLRMSR